MIGAPIVFSFDKKSVNENLFTMNGVFFDIFCCKLRKIILNF